MPANETPSDQLTPGSQNVKGKSAKKRGSRINLILGVIVIALILAITGAGALALGAVSKQKAPTTMAGARISDLEAQVKSHPKDPDAYLSLADAYFSAKDFSSARRVLGEMKSSLEPTGVALAINTYAVAKIDESQGNVAAAKQGYIDALKVAEVLSARYELGLIYLNEKDYTHAVDNLERYVAGAPQGDANALKALGRAYEGAGDTAKALAAYKKAQGYMPTDTEANDAVKRLEAK